MTGFINLAFSGAAYYVIENNKTPIIVGGLIGSAIMINFQSLMSAIFWGQLSLCTAVTSTVRGYSCDHKADYRALCLFSVVLLILQFFLTILLINYRGEILKEYTEYSEILGVDDAYKPSNISSSTSNSAPTKPRPTADL